MDAMDAARLEPEHRYTTPLGRRGLCSVVHNGKLYLYGGFTSQIPLTELYQRRDTVDVFDFLKFEWSSRRTEGDLPDTISGSSSAVIGDCLYIFGGWFQGWRNADIHELNLTSFLCKKLTNDAIKDTPLSKDKAGMVDYGDEMLCVMGGYGHKEMDFTCQKGASYHWDPQSSWVLGWTNELHLFHTKARKI